MSMKPDMSNANNLTYMSVYPIDDDTLGMLYLFLSEREPYQSISHTGMPTLSQHKYFVGTKPYKEWYIVKDNNTPIGSYYITFKNEIGIHIAKGHRGIGYGKAILKKIISENKGKSLFANINPENGPSIEFFTKSHGFKHIQNTYRLDVPNDVS